MSYDVELLTPVFDGNITSNIAPMWRQAGVDLAEWHGARAADLLPVLRAAIEDIEQNPDRYEPLNPPNGWGDVATCLRFLRELLAACDIHRNAVIRVSH